MGVSTKTLAIAMIALVVAIAVIIWRGLRESRDDYARPAPTSYVNHAKKNLLMEYDPMPPSRNALGGRVAEQAVAGGGSKEPSTACDWLKRDVAEAGGDSTNIDKVCRQYLAKCGQASTAAEVVSLYMNSDPQGGGQGGHNAQSMLTLFQQDLGQKCMAPMPCNDSPDPGERIPCPSFLGCAGTGHGTQGRCT